MGEEDEEGPATETHENRRYHNDHYCETAGDRRQIDTRDKQGRVIRCATVRGGL